jgi:PAS domain S-box-containing protein
MPDREGGIVNLRTRAIVLSALPLVIVLLLALPETILQLRVSAETEHSRRANLALAAAYDVEDYRLDAAGMLRRQSRGDKTAATPYALAITNMRASILRLGAAAGPDLTAIEGARRVTSDGAAILEQFDSINAELRRGHVNTADAIMSSSRYLDLIQKLQGEVRVFVAATREVEASQVRSVEQLWNISLQLFVLGIVALAVASALLLYHSGQAVRSIMELGRKSERYRRGEPLGAPSRRRDEIAVLDAALHDFVVDQELHERQLRRYRLLADVTEDIILFVDRTDLTVVEANAAALAAYGYERAAFIGKPFAMIRAPGNALDAETIARADTPAGLSIEGMHQRSDGATFPVEVHARTAEVDGRHTIIGTVRDISERRRTAEQLARAHEETLRANSELQRNQTELAQAKSKLEEYARALEGRVQVSEEKFRGFLTASPDAMLVVDEVGNIVLASERVETLFGYVPDELIGRPFDLLMPERFRGAYAQHVGDFAHAPRVREMGGGLDLCALRKDGSEFPTEISLSPHQTPEGLVVIAAIRDITRRNQAEVALQQAQKMEAVGQLTSGVAHDFNNVLGAVIGNLDLLTEDIADNPKAAHHAEQALAAALSGAELAKRMLAFSRRQPLHPKSLDLHETMASVTPLVRRTISEQITIVANIADGLWLALADPSQIENAVLNLALNARDAMSAGGTLTIDCQNVTIDEDYAPAYGADFQPGDYVVISVTDTGHGMPPDVRARAFDPFFTTKQHGVGTGLGLSMVLGTMKQSGGTAQIYSEPGLGTTVRLLLPRSVESKKSDDGRAIGGDVLSRGNERVLVVEDDERIREVSYTMLTGLGYQVETAESADEALARIIGGERFALVFSDVVMPGTHTGITLARELRTIDPHLKIVLTSGYASPSNFPDNFEPLGIELISKPFRKAELAALIRRVLDEEDLP